MAQVYMYSFYSDFIQMYDQIPTKIYMQQKFRDTLVLHQFTKLQIPTFPMSKSSYESNKHKFEHVSKEFPLLNMMFICSCTGKCLVLCNGNYKSYNNKDEMYRFSYGITNNKPIKEHLVN